MKFQPVDTGSLEVMAERTGGTKLRPWHKASKCGTPLPQPPREAAGADRQLPFA